MIYVVEIRNQLKKVILFNENFFFKVVNKMNVTINVHLCQSLY